MAEVVRFSDNQEQRLIAAAQEIGWLALTEVATKYGTGSPVPEVMGAEANLAFHHLGHTMHVRNDARQAAKALGLSEFDQSLVDAAAKAHDIVQLRARGVMEEESAQWLEDRLRRAGFEGDDIKAGGLAVRGTAVVMDGPVMRQVASLQEYSSERERLIAMSVACADMASLYQPRGPLLSHDLYKEFQGVDPADEPSMDGLPDYQNGQITLMRHYLFPHPVGEALFGTGREATIEYHEGVLRALGAGAIQSWGQLLERDMHFAQGLPV